MSHLLVAWVVCSGIAFGQGNDTLRPFNKPEEFTIRSRKPEELQILPSPLQSPPPTVSVPHPDATEVKLTLDEAIRTALQNSEVIRVLAGTTAVSTGQTIYAPAIAHTNIDSQLATFDPVLSANNTYGRSNTESVFFDGVNGIFARNESNFNNFNLGVSQRNLAGGVGSLTFDNQTFRADPAGILNPRNQPGLEVSYTQPLLAGAGVQANRVPILLARIQTEQSYFRFKDSYQQMVRSVIDGYWNIVFARTDLWAREQQVKFAKFLYDQADAELEAGLGDVSSVAQRKVALANFRVSLLEARASVLNTEAALKNVLGLPPNDGIRLVPVTPPTRKEIEFNWPELIDMTTTYRPDVIEFKLILDADQQRLIQAKNLARPQLNATGSYRWDGVSGELPTGQRIRSGASGDYTLGVNFSLPVRLRASRANLRSVELAIAQDRANLKQAQHQATHDVAAVLRNLATTYAQYEAQSEVREAAFENLKQLVAREISGLANFQVVLQGISDWGNAVSAEARSMTLYNSQLATLEEQTGTILETHGIRFYEERYASLGPWGRKGPCFEYPKDLRPQENSMRYEGGEEPSEKFFNLDQAPTRESRADDSGDMEDDWKPLDESADDDDQYEREEFKSLEKPGNGFEVERNPASKSGPSLGRSTRTSAPPVPIRPKWKRVAGRR